MTTLIIQASANFLKENSARFKNSYLLLQFFMIQFFKYKILLTHKIHSYISKKFIKINNLKIKNKFKILLKTKNKLHVLNDILPLIEYSVQK